MDSSQRSYASVIWADKAMTHRRLSDDKNFYVIDATENGLHDEDSPGAPPRARSICEASPVTTTF